MGEPTEAALKVLVEKLGTNNTTFNSTLSTLSPKARATACSGYYDNRNRRVSFSIYLFFIILFVR